MSKESKTHELGTTVVTGSQGQLGSELCRQLGAAADVKDSDAFGRVEFVAGNSQEVNGDSGEVERDLADRLNGVGVGSSSLSSPARSAFT